MPVLPDLLGCDLCVLAYQLYHQSVIWPLDPWYEFFAHSVLANRRDNFMKLVHRWADQGRRDARLYGGPASMRGFGQGNATLDPVITAYEQLEPRAPAFTRDGSNYLALRAPSYLVDPITRVAVCSYTRAPTKPFPASTQLTWVRNDGSGDHVIAFEGGTGSYGGKDPAYSLMGYVLRRARPHADGWDACIVFRGSRSGDAFRAARQGVLSHMGNADWVSDTDTALVEDAFVSKTGRVARGFANAMATCTGTIQASLVELAQTYGTPSGILVAGHSLGAALAAHFASAIVVGTGGESIKRALPTWPWDRLRGQFYAEPPVGDETYAAAFDEKTSARAPYVFGDAVVECSKSVAKANTGIGKVMSLAAGGVQIGTLVPMNRPSGANGSDDSHELYLIRNALVAAQRSTPLEASIASAQPWAAYASFTDMLAGKPASFPRTHVSIVAEDQLRPMLRRYRFKQHFGELLRLFLDIVVDKGAYVGFHFAKTYAEKRERVDVAMSLTADLDGRTRAAEVADVTATQAAALFAFNKEGKASFVQGQDVDRFLGLGLVLSAYESAVNTRIRDFHAMPELRACLEATWKEDARFR